MKKRLLKWTLILALLAVALGIAGLAFRNSILRVLLERKIRARTGMNARIGMVSAGLFRPVVTIRNLTLYNTAAFDNTPFLDIPELHIELDAAALRQHKLRVKLARLDLAELDVVRNKLGQTNVFSLLSGGRQPVSGHGGLQQFAKEFKFTGIDVLNLTLGKTRYIDLANPRNNRETDLDLRNQVFRNVNSEGDVYGVLFMIWLRSGGRFSIGPPHVPAAVARPGPSPARHGPNKEGDD